jgi:hypothetical protein
MQSKQRAFTFGEWAAGGDGPVESAARGGYRLS